MEQSALLNLKARALPTTKLFSWLLWTWVYGNDNFNLIEEPFQNRDY